MKTKVVIIGAGPAGLTAGYCFRKNDVDVSSWKPIPFTWGHLAHGNLQGFHFDIGGHVSSQNQTVEDLWTRFLPNDM